MIILDTNVLSELIRGVPDPAVLATRNTKDFAETGVELINPWREG